MKVNYITLTNIGPYLGENTYDFTTTKEKNVILIGGKNGAGKTTLLNSIKFGLFGSFSLGLKTDTAVYFNKIKSLLNIYTEDNNYSIEIGVSISDGFSLDDYRIKRTWKKTNKSLDEELKVIKNDNELNSDDTILLMDKLKYISSPELIDSFIYDGEFISSISNDNELSEFIKNTFISIFNINMLNEINKDVNTYLIDNMKQKNMDSNTTETIKLIQRITENKNNITTLEKSKVSLLEMKSSLSLKKQELEKQFFTRGGVEKENQAALKERFLSISNESEEMQKSLKHFIENDFPFAICGKLFNEAHEQIKREEPNILYKKLTEIEIYLEVSNSDLNKKLKQHILTDEVIHNVNNDFYEQFVIRGCKVKESLALAKTNINRRSEFKDVTKDLKEVLGKNEQIDYLKELYSDMQETSSEIANVDKQIFEKERRIKELSNNNNVLYSQLETLKNINKKNNTKENGYALATRFLDINEKYIQAKKNMKLNEISNVCKDIFNLAIRKKDYIKQIVISDNFSVSLLDKNKNTIQFSMLSAGEKQLLISSIIWSFFKVSKRKEMFIFDTPVARLDKENRKNFIDNIVKTIGDQVVILSTNSEIIEDCYDVLKDNLAKEYTIKYNEINKNSEISEGYFKEA